MVRNNVPMINGHLGERLGGCGRENTQEEEKKNAAKQSWDEFQNIPNGSLQWK